MRLLPDFTPGLFIPGRDFGDHSTSDRTRPRLYQLRILAKSGPHIIQTIRAFRIKPANDISYMRGNLAQSYCELCFRTSLPHECGFKWRNITTPIGGWLIDVISQKPFLQSSPN